jgi:hypothetical protein
LRSGNRAGAAAWLQWQGNNRAGVLHGLCPTEVDARRGAVNPRGAQRMDPWVIGRDGVGEEFVHVELRIEGGEHTGTNRGCQPNSGVGFLVDGTKERE